MSRNIRLIFEPLGVTARIAPGDTILDAARAEAVPLRGDCGGKGVCGKCLVQVNPPPSCDPPGPRESELLGPQRLAQGFRLACQARPMAPATVVLPDGLADNQAAPGKTGLVGQFPVDQVVSRHPVPARWAERAAGPGQSLRDRLEEAAGLAEGPWQPAALKQAAEPGVYNQEMTLVNHVIHGITALCPGHQPEGLGLAVDLGTTTVAGYLCRLTDGRVLATAGRTNPQRRYGEDVISRISHLSDHPEELATLQGLAAQAVNEVLADCLHKAGAAHHQVDEVVLVGNTTMQEIFCGLHPHALGRIPYLPVERRGRELWAKDLGLNLAPGAGVYLFPVISGYLGGDALSAALAERVFEGEATTLVVDIGTNGELILGNRHSLWGASCATGPALEGAQMSCGVRAVPGAVHRVSAQGGQAVCELIEPERAGHKAVGICGSGLLDAAAALRELGVLAETGRLNPEAAGVECDAQGIGRRMVLVPAEHSATGQPVGLTLKDVRQLQLAKAAMRVGIEMLMERAGVTKVDRLVLTGAFGARFNWKNALKLGLMPPEVARGQVDTVENSAGQGAVMALLSARRRHEAEELAGRVGVVELGGDPEFGLRFAHATSFPSLDSIDLPD